MSSRWLKTGTKAEREKKKKKKELLEQHIYTFTRSHWQTRTMSLLYKGNKLYNIEPYHSAHKAALNELTD